MAARPTSAFILSLMGGIITLFTAITSIITWLELYSESGWSFAYSSLMFGDMPSGEAIVFFIVGAICAVLIIIGAILQYSGVKSRVKQGSILILIATFAAAPGTFFGGLFGGPLSLIGAALGLTWKRPRASVPPTKLGTMLRAFFRVFPHVLEGADENKRHPYHQDHDGHEEEEFRCQS